MRNNKGMPYNPYITVCDICFHASCWQGEFMCDDSYGANITDLLVSAVIDKQGPVEMEHPYWWNRDLYAKNAPLLTADDLRGHGISDPEMLDLEDSEVSK